MQHRDIIKNKDICAESFLRFSFLLPSKILKIEYVIFPAIRSLLEFFDVDVYPFLCWILCPCLMSIPVLVPKLCHVLWVRVMTRYQEITLQWFYSKPNFTQHLGNNSIKNPNLVNFWSKSFGNVDVQQLTF